MKQENEISINWGLVWCSPHYVIVEPVKDTYIVFHVMYKTAQHLTSSKISKMG